MRRPGYNIIAAVACFLLFASTFCEAATATAYLRLSVTIRPWLKFNAEQHIYNYYVTPADSERGYIDLHDVFTIRIRTNEQNDIGIRTTAVGVDSILVKESGQGGFTETSTLLDLGRQPIGELVNKKLDFRIILPKGAREGLYALNLTVSPHVF